MVVLALYISINVWKDLFSDSFKTIFQKAHFLRKDEFVDSKYRKIPKISPGVYMFQWPFLRGLYISHNRIGLYWLEICVSKSIGLAYLGGNVCSLVIICSRFLLKLALRT